MLSLLLLYTHSNSVDSAQKWRGAAKGDGKKIVISLPTHLDKHLEENLFNNTQTMLQSSHSSGSALWFSDHCQRLGMRKNIISEKILTFHIPRFVVGAMISNEIRKINLFTWDDDVDDFDERIRWTQQVNEGEIFFWSSSMCKLKNFHNIFSQNFQSKIAILPSLRGPRCRTMFMWNTFCAFVKNFKQNNNESQGKLSIFINFPYSVRHG